MPADDGRSTLFVPVVGDDEQDEKCTCTSGRTPIVWGERLGVRLLERHGGCHTFEGTVNRFGGPSTAGVVGVGTQ